MEPMGTFEHVNVIIVTFVKLIFELFAWLDFKFAETNGAYFFLHFGLGKSELERRKIFEMELVLELARIRFFLFIGQKDIKRDLLKIRMIICKFVLAKKLNSNISVLKWFKRKLFGGMRLVYVLLWAWLLFIVLLEHRSVKERSMWIYQQWSKRVYCGVGTVWRTGLKVGLERSILFWFELDCIYEY